MAGVIGNKNAVGNKGGGRKSAFQELSDAEDIQAIWKDERKLNELHAKIESGKYSVRDMFIYKCLEGEIKTMNKLIDKHHPNKHEVKAEIDSGEQVRELKKLMGTEDEKENNV